MIRESLASHDALWTVFALGLKAERRSDFEGSAIRMNDGYDILKRNRIERSDVDECNYQR